jgi:hypothetical protein
MARKAERKEIQKSRHTLRCEGCGIPTDSVEIELWNGIELARPRCSKHLGVHPTEENQGLMTDILEEAIR